MGYSPWGRKESDTTEQLTLSPKNVKRNSCVHCNEPQTQLHGGLPSKTGAQDAFSSTKNKGYMNSSISLAFALILPGNR